MRRLVTLILLLTMVCPGPARAHVGSPDIFFDGMVGKWRVHITIRMPGVVPGRAQIMAQVLGQEPVTVSFTPLASHIAVSNAPPAETAKLVPGETNLYTGDLWLMTVGAYSIDVRIHGASGEDGAVQIPVNSVAITQLPLPPWLGGILLALGAVLFCGGMAIVAAAAGESVLPAQSVPGKTERRKYWTAAVVTGAVLALALYGGKKWWDSDERDFRARLRQGGWPEVTANVRTDGGQRLLDLTFGSTGNSPSGPNAYLTLSPDHGKLLHLFLVRLPDHAAFAHIHPVRQGNRNFAVALPPLPEGDYELFCDLTLDSGLSSTATNRVHLPAVPAASAANSLASDPDDSWAVESAVAVRAEAGRDTVCHLPDGTQIIWQAHPPTRAKRNAALQFAVLDQTGHPAALEPYMGMMSHAAVLRSDGLVFDHLHPTGNYSMAAQMIFDSKIAKETGALPAGMMKMPDGTIMDSALMGHASPGVETSTISLPYEFPTPGDYRIWVQFKLAGKIQTGIFDTTVQ